MEKEVFQSSPFCDLNREVKDSTYGKFAFQWLSENLCVRNSRSKSGQMCHRALIEWTKQTSNTSAFLLPDGHVQL